MPEDSVDIVSDEVSDEGTATYFRVLPVGKMTTIIYAIVGMPLFLPLPLQHRRHHGQVLQVDIRQLLPVQVVSGRGQEASGEEDEEELRLNTDYEEQSSSESLEISIPVPQPTDRGSEASEATTGYTEGSYDVENVTVPLTICLFIMVGYICGGALLFCKWEEYWTFLDASYFCFISLSTIGFGDLVPGDKIYGRGVDFYKDMLELSFVFCSIYLMLGMALIAMCFNLMQEEVIHKIRTTIQTVKYVLRCNR
ncbi:hypothetical protein NQ318_012923 [Aromia moschata]|uniref:Potassium channel domain-containing protein n=1 Tax=Aromia moschata TaxID=1265417 RepID=A0AAV8XN09_9CUCU|nr:hypothetical protein NQ318_012923 [Aromia moschata]